MGNLGGYQLMSVMAKSVGGPCNYVMVLMTLGYAVFRLIEAGMNEVVDHSLDVI